MAIIRFLFALLLTFPLLAQSSLAEAELTTTFVNGNIYMISGPGGNIGVSVGDDGILLVDDKFEPLADKIRASLTGLAPGKLKFILNTHYHGDHTGANPVFGPEATIIAHHNVRKRLSSERRHGDEVTPPMAREGWPVITFDDQLSVHFNGEEIKAAHYPASHTDGDLVITFTSSQVEHLGDIYFEGRFPYVDLDAGGTVQGVITTLTAIIERLTGQEKIIPGHGKLANFDDLKRDLDMTVATTAYIRKQMAKGQSVEEIIAKGLPKKWKDYSWNFIPEARWIEIVYRSYSP